ncbi:TetR/AcrR family transcriptional regulator [Sphingobium sp. HBC34]|uniref:TetR/AcrR family transcriptional regulator n=1 Tax=Sphingobium cyanobacteriorum TaxID=3063954 RepID=A0ABT8ZJT9_9SPHN|nr:TetR/AcrR family transcriptional regulator [Sphingobium sp. HBC34]MDO7834413.1 TetR/AcrR family transcriptional regulator [Sphingobium sp. HBC34]
MKTELPGPQRGMSARKWEITCSIAAAFARRGYHAVSMRDLAADLNLNQGTLYHHFPSKDEALLAICIVGQEELKRNLAGVLAAHAAFPQRIGHLFAAHITSLKTLGDFIDVYASQWSLVPGTLASPLREGWRLQRSTFETLFADAMERGEIPAGTPVRDAMRMLIALFRTVNILHRTGHSDAMHGFSAFATDVFVRGLSVEKN